ncbi:indolepyruvate oxidoreductase [Gemmobacter nanjingensis]|uniref:Indolepyruvate oxidoreductase n=1 Tax=Gemmobacter nanjingensis TaxID=488454 RepID=A0ABQ3FKY7_9RHOB|nr:indolepyruvate oxidoreductase subunit beta family protein [Gemmobacter nanjingensis]GHC28491.1 indolepyruvate oxidoreductase [Gemmobacter nanjingensis]
MTVQQSLAPRQPDPALGQIIKLACLAVGGQGGGVLTGWIEDLARANGYAAQATSVAGVAQRTGATIYYVEMAPYNGGPMPVFSLAPASGDVDIMISAEMMEAGRAIMRGFVTPDRTTLIASTHRALAVSEKMVPGNGIASSEEVRAAAEVAAQRLILADFEGLAVKVGSVISASLFGGLAGSGALPFPREAFEDAIRAGGKGVEASLRAFAVGYEAAQAGVAPAPVAAPKNHAQVVPQGSAKLQAEWNRLTGRITALPAEVAELALPGLRKVVEFQDLAYGAAYLDRLETLVRQDRADKAHAFSREAAKYLANAMAYDDVIRVADLKTRGERFSRIRREMGAKDGNLMHLTEFMHPGPAEIAGMLPAGIGRKVQDSPAWMARLDRWLNKGRRVRTDTIPSFLMLYTLGGLRGWRLKSLRHAEEMAHMERWISRATAALGRNYDLAVEIVKCRRLVKGYSDTHARGQSKFDRVLAGIALIEAREDAADWARRLREAALLDEEGKALDGAIDTIRSFA